MITPALLTVAKTDRERYIISRVLAGVSYARIGKELGLSRQRVHAITLQLQARLARAEMRARMQSETPHDHDA